MLPEQGAMRVKGQVLVEGNLDANTKGKKNSKEIAKRR